MFINWLSDQVKLSNFPLFHASGRVSKDFFNLLISFKSKNAFKQIQTFLTAHWSNFNVSESATTTTHHTDYLLTKSNRDPLKMKTTTEAPTVFLPTNFNERIRTQFGYRSPNRSTFQWCFIPITDGYAVC